MAIHPLVAGRDAGQRLEVGDDVRDVVRAERPALVLAEAGHPALAAGDALRQPIVALLLEPGGVVELGAGQLVALVAVTGRAALRVDVLAEGRVTAHRRRGG